MQTAERRQQLHGNRAAAGSRSAEERYARNTATRLTHIRTNRAQKIDKIRSPRWSELSQSVLYKSEAAAGNFEPPPL